MNLNIFSKRIIIIVGTGVKVEMMLMRAEGWCRILLRKIEEELELLLITLTEANHQSLALTLLQTQNKIKNLKLCTNNYKTKR